MSNKTQLQTNNTTLDTLITRVTAAKDTAAALPDAGSGGTVETCNVTISSPTTDTVYTVYYLDLETNNIASLTGNTGTIKCLKQGCIGIYCGDNIIIDGSHSIQRTYGATFLIAVFSDITVEIFPHSTGVD